MTNAVGILCFEHFSVLQFLEHQPVAGTQDVLLSLKHDFQSCRNIRDHRYSLVLVDPANSIPYLLETAKMVLAKLDS